MRIALVLLIGVHGLAAAQTRDTETYRHLKTFLDAVPAINTHDHLRPHSALSTFRVTEHGPGMNLQGIWADSYFAWCNTVTPWRDGMPFGAWWEEARDDFDNARATSFYQYLLPAFQDLYGVDFNSITDAQAADLDQRIFENYRSADWVAEVVTERANIELLLNDPNWDRLGHTAAYPFEAFVFNVTMVVRGYHRDAIASAKDNPYVWAEAQGMRVESLAEYLEVLGALFAARKADGAVAIKTTLAYERDLRFEDVSRERAEAVFGRAADSLSAEEKRDFADFIMWRLCELSAKYALPFQIHTGQARVQGSNPMLLVDLIQANKETNFVLFHGGYPWVGETAVIMQRHWQHVWVDSCWLPTLSYSTAKRAFHEWLDAFPANRILWGADSTHAEGVYGATAFTRRCLAEVLAEKVDQGDLRMDHAEAIGRKIMRENALEAYPLLRERVKDPSS